MVMSGKLLSARAPGESRSPGMAIWFVLFILYFVCAAQAESTAADECSVSAIPPPGGHYVVGTTVLAVERLHHSGSARQVQLWYPAQKSLPAEAAAYLPDTQLIRALRSAKFLDLPGCVFDAWTKMKTAALADAPPAALPAKAPLVMIAPGAGVPRVSYSYYAQQLASDGYIVATIDFSEGGFLVANGKLLQEGPSGDEESDYAEQAMEMARHMSDLLDEYLAKFPPSASELAAAVLRQIDATRIAAIGHSLGGAAVLDACRSDSRIKGCVDLDGIPEKPVAQDGIKTSVLFIRSHPDYSAADLARLHRDPAKWQAMGEKIKADIAKLLVAPGPGAWVVSIHGTGHMSYSDAPLTMPETITKFGGRSLPAKRVLPITVQLIKRYLAHAFDRNIPFSTEGISEATVQLSRQDAR